MNEAQLDKLAEDIQRLVSADQSSLALDLVDERLAMQPDNQRLLYLKGCLHYERNELRDAMAAMEASASLPGQLAAQAYYMLGNIYRDLDDIASACEFYNRGLELAPAMTDAWVNMGSVLDDAGQHAMALRCYDAALAIDAYDAVAWCNRGNTLREMEQYRDAATSYAQAVRLMPDSFEAELGLVACQIQLQEPRALDKLRQLFETSRNPLALFELAVALSYSQQFEEALECFDQLISHGSDEPALWNNRAECLARLGRTPEALQSFDRALEADPFFEAAFLGKARTLLNLKRSKEAKQVVNQLLNICSEDLRESATVRQLLESL